MFEDKVVYLNCRFRVGSSIHYDNLVVGDAETGVPCLDHWGAVEAVIALRVVEADLLLVILLDGAAHSGVPRLDLRVALVTLVTLVITEADVLLGVDSAGASIGVHVGADEADFALKATSTSCARGGNLRLGKSGGKSNTDEGE